MISFFAKISNYTATIDTTRSSRHIFLAIPSTIDRIALLMAEPEKTVLDYLYLSSGLNTPKDLAAMRLNTVAIMKH